MTNRVKSQAKKTSYTKAKPGTRLWSIGFLATVWWAVSCLYVALLFWWTMDEYVSMTGQHMNGSFWEALSRSLQGSVVLQSLLLIICIGWVVGANIWTKELKRQKIPYKLALKDLFLTIRK